MTPSRGSTDATGPVIALTGATGFLGSHIADVLLARGYQVRASVRATSSLRWLEGKAIATVQADLTDPAACRAFLDGTAGLIHCAGVVSAPSEELYQVGNVSSTGCLLEAAADAWTGADRRPTFVLISSLAAHGPADLEHPARETDPCRPITAYGRSKLAAEALLTEGDWPYRTVTLRPPALYGPRDREFLPLVKMATRGWTGILGRKMSGLSLVDGRDAAAAAVRLLESPSTSGPYFVDDGRRGYDWPALAAALGTMAGRRIRTLRVPLGLLKFASLLAGPGRAARSPILNPDRIRDLEVPGWVCDGSRLVKDTGFAPRFDAATGLADVLAFYRKENWL